MSAEIHLNASNFKTEVLEAELPVLVDFYADWCMPCKMIAPMISQLASEYEGRAKVGKLNVDEEAELAGKYNIISIPTLLVFKGGEVVKQKTGAVPKQELEKLIADLV